MQDRIDFAPEAASSFSLQEYAGILRRRRAIILQAFVIVLVAGVLVTIFQAPVYQTGGKLLVEPNSFVISQLNTSDPLADLFRVNAQYSIPTQIELLQSGDMRSRVAAKVGGNVPGFNVGTQDGTSIITINAEGENPDNIANSINALMHIYVDQVVDQSGQDLKHAADFTKKLADDADEDIRTTEQAIQDFKRKRNIPDLESARATAASNVNTLTGKYQAETVDYQALEARISATTKHLADLKAHPLVNAMQNLGIDKDTQKLLDPAIQAIENKINDIDLQLQVQRGPLDQGESNPTIKLLEYQRAQQVSRRADLIKSMVDRNRTLDPDLLKTENDLLQMSIDASAKATELNLTSQLLANAQKKLNEFPLFEYSYTDLQDKLADARARSGNYHSKLYDLDLRRQTRRIPARVLEEAPVPGSPVRPKKAQGILIAGVLGLVAGLGLALLQELFDDRINSPEDAERALALPNLGYIPMIEEEGLRLIRDISTFSPLMESYRTLRTNINFAAVGNDVKSMLVSSSVPAEGKSTTCANLAMAMALDGKRVIIVDADLRRPAQHKLFKTASSPGLTDILVGTHSIDDVLQPTKVEGVSIIPAGSPPPNPAELLGSAAMGHFLANVEAMADVVLFDSPPTLAVADSVVLAARVDGVLMVIGFGETKKTNTRQAKGILTRANAHILGTVLNRMIGPSSGYYYGKYYVPTIDTASISGNGGKNGNGTSSSMSTMSGGGSDSGVGQGVALLSDTSTSETAGEDEAREEKGKGF